MRVLFWMQVFDPEPQIKGLTLASKIVQAGNEVIVITGFPNYPGGKIYPGYSIKFYSIEYIEGIKVIRVPLFPSHSGSIVGRLLNYLSFGFSSFIASLFFRKIDLIYVCGPPVTVGIAAALSGMIKRIPVVYDIQDLWPDSLNATGMFNSPIGLAIVGSACQFLYRHVTMLIVQSPGIRLKLIERGVPHDKIFLVYNWCNESAILNCETNSVAIKSGIEGMGASARFSVLFAGNLGKAQDLYSILEAAQILQKRKSKVDIYLLGDGIEKASLEREVKNRGIENVFFIPAVPMSHVGKYLNIADVLLVHLKDSELFRVTVPAKTQAYLATGKPVLMAVAGDGAELITKSGGGIVAKPSNPDSIADGIISLLESSDQELAKMGNCGKQYYWEHLSLDQGAKKFNALFKKIAK
jgi:colanic acid biosynthesis glycosyl transferase WcaI